MNRPCIKLRSSLFLLLLPFIGFAQRTSFDTAGFYRHLVKNNLLLEQVAFTRNMQKVYSGNPVVRDSLYLNLSVAWYKLGKPDSVRKALQKISQAPVFSASSARVFIALLMLDTQFGRTTTFIHSNTGNPLPSIFVNDATISIKMLHRENTSNDTIPSLYSQPVFDIKNEYEKMPRHSPFLAGIYSALIPGLGKLYLGYKQQALSAFLENGFLGAQAAESYFRAGVSSPRFIITAGLFSLFYGGNIWGSILLAKKQKRDHRKQIDYEVFEYYSTAVSKANY
jgi:hypothetical protein